MLVASTPPFAVRRSLALAVRRRAAPWTVVVYDEWHSTVAALGPSGVTVSAAWRGCAVGSCSDDVQR